MQQQKTALGPRVALAVGLLVGFYALALGLVAFFGWLIYFSLTQGRVNARILIVAPIVIFAILRGVFFVDRDDEVNGVRVTPADEPGLWQLVRDVAQKMGAVVPDEIVLVPDVNAFVYQHSRFLGLLPGKRVMGVGLGLVSVLHVDQLRGVVAHELGHYAGGDTRIGPLLYRADESLRRTVTHLKGGILAGLFRGYWKLFARLTLALRRRQELAADRAAVGVAGREAHATALQETGPAGLAYNFFVNQYVAPLLHANTRPDNLYSGFRSLLSDESRRDELAQLRDELERETTEPYDSHPALPDRLAQLEDLPPGEALSDTRPAREVLSDPDAAEGAVTRWWSLAVTDGGATRAVAWESDAGRVYGEGTRLAAAELAEAVAAVDGGPNPAGMERILAALEQGRHAEIVARLVPRIGEIPAAERNDAIRSVLANSLAGFVCVFLVESGRYDWQLSWSGPLQVRDDNGNVPDVEEKVEAAVASPEGVQRLRAWLEQTTSP